MSEFPSVLDLASVDIAVVVVNYRTADLALSCLRAVAFERLALPRLRAIIVDGGSADGSVERLAHALEDPEFASWTSLLALPVNGGFGWANNQAMLLLLNGERPPEYIHLLNPDAILEPGAMLALVRCLHTHPSAAAAGSQLLDPDGSLSGSAFSFPTLRREFARGARTGLIERLLALRRDAEALQEVGEVDWVTGASVLLRASALREVGLFDDGFFLYHEEVELMWRLRRAGWTIMHEPRSRVGHIGGAATGVREGSTNVKIMPRRPAYWYQSRRRFFARSLGQPAASGALALWLAGHLFFRLSRPFRRGAAKTLLAHELRDQWKHARRHRSDGVAAVTPATASPGPLPSWMEYAE